MKKFLSIVTFVFFLATGLVISIPFWIQFNQFKSPLLSFIEKQYHLHLEIDQAHLKWGRVTTLEIDRLSLTDLSRTDPKNPSSVLLRFEKMSLQIKVKSLLNRRLRGQLVLTQPVIKWTPSSQNSFAIPSWLSLVIAEKIAIEDGTFHYFPTKSPPWELTQLNLTLSHMNVGPPDQPIDLIVDGKIGATIPFHLDAKALLDTKHQKVQVNEAKLRLASSEIQLRGEWGKEQRSLQGSLQMKEASITYADLFNKPAGTPFDLIVQGRQLGEELQFDKIEVHLANLQATGTGKVSLLPDHPVEFSFETTTVNLAEILPMIPRRPSDQVEGTPSVQLDISGPLSDPKHWEYRATLASDLMRIGTGEFSRVNALVLLTPPLLTVKSLDADLHDLHLSGSGTVDFTGLLPAWDIALSLQEAKLESLSRELTGLQGVFSGTGTLSLQAKGFGTTKDEIRQVLSGEGKLLLKNGSCDVALLAQNIFSSSFNNLLTLSPPLFLQQLRPIAINNMEIPFTIDKGEIHLASLRLSDDNQTFELSGWVNLDQQINMAGQYYLSKIKTDSWLTNPRLRSFLVDGEGRFKVPFTLTGLLSSPVVSPDLTYLRTQIGRASSEMIESILSPPETATAPFVEALDKTIERGN